MAPVTVAENAFQGGLTIADFAAPTLEQWRELAQGSLGGTALEALTTATLAGIEVRPLYTVEDLAGLPAVAAHPLHRPWQACQRVDHPDPAAAAAEIAEDTSRGVDSAWLVLDRSVRTGHHPEDPDTGPTDGIVVTTADDLAELLGAANSAHTALILASGGSAVAAAAALIAACRSLGLDPATLDGGLGCDPLGALAADAELPCGLARSLALLPEIVAWCDRSAPRLRALEVSTLPYVLAGASEVHELALALATGAAYLRAVAASGVALERTYRHLRFVVPVGRDLLLEVAKLRALRLTWGRVVEACGGAGDAVQPWVHAVTSPRTLTVQDPWVNLLRATTQAFAAVSGGADALTVLPFDAAAGPSDRVARRLAANLHAILREEASLDRVADPLAGSYAVESLTAELAERAWQRFQQIEADGGVAAALLGGSIRRELAEAREARRRAVAGGRDPITGVTSHPNPDERPLQRPAVHGRAVRSRARDALARRGTPQAELDRLRSCCTETMGDGAAVDAAIEACAAGATLAEVARALAVDEAPIRIEPLPVEREAAPFERSRDRGGTP